ncbi:serine hydroxymethyltransferase [Patescibacteria group bacterium]|nr:serine hydroxymethyltransferase [Patescibacteria group bacterium]
MSDKIFELIKQEEQRQKVGLEMIPSENYVSKNVLKALGSILTDKYSEGYPGARHYGGNEIIDQIETEAQRLACQLFGVKSAIVQPYSGSPANLAVDLGLVEPGGVIMGLSLSSGGHLTHGAKASFTSKIFQAIQYEVGEDGKINLEEVTKLAQQHQPKLIWVGLTAYPYTLDFAGFAKIAQSVGAYLVADISHISGLVAAKVLPSPVQYVDVITTTTHKTLRGPRGAMILITQKGLDKDPQIVEKLEKGVFPGLQGGPHDNVTAAIAIALQEASQPQFKEYAEQILKNAQVLAKQLETKTENHLLLLDLSMYGFGLGYQAQIALELAGITVNRNTIPHDPASAYYPSGIRLGTPALTSRGMKEEEMVKIASWIKEVLEMLKGFDLPQNQPERKDFIKEFRSQMKENLRLKEIKKEVEQFAAQFPLPGVTDE